MGLIVVCTICTICDASKSNKSKILIQYKWRLGSRVDTVVCQWWICIEGSFSSKSRDVLHSLFFLLRCYCYMVFAVFCLNISAIHSEDWAFYILHRGRIEANNQFQSKQFQCNSHIHTFTLLLDKVQIKHIEAIRTKHSCQWILWKLYFGCFLLFFLILFCKHNKRKNQLLKI